MDRAFTVIALISAFNEGDIISKVIGHLVENGILVYLLDNHSSDDTFEQAAEWLGKGLLHIEPFPQCSGEAGKFDWTGILHRKAELASELRADWFIHHDADEIRESPWPGLNLKEAIRWVDTLDYNCVNFRVLNFPPLNNDFKQGDDPRTHFTHYEAAADFDEVQLKCWKSGVPISLVQFGGHEVVFEGRRIFPIPFLLRHYPVRSQPHGVRKIFLDRRNRFVEDERERGWHRQYDAMSNTHCFVKDAGTLRRFDLNQARLELQVPQTTLTNFKALAEHSVQYAAHLEQELQDLRQHVANVEQDRDRLRQHVVNIEQGSGHLRQHVASLEQELAEVQSSFVWRSSIILRRLLSPRAKDGKASEHQLSLNGSHSLFSCLDMPAEAETTVVETCVVRGWTCSPSGIDSVEILVDGHQVQQFLPHIERPDVALIYPDVLGSAQSGFDVSLDLSTLSEGVHEMQVLIRDRGGNESRHRRSLRIQTQSLG
jgi:hypothetical protein